MDRAPFYSRGLRFSCTQCSACCRHDPGFVFLSGKDAERLTKALALGYSEFLEAFCRWIPVGNGTEHLSLREKSNFDCIFWNQGCTVYEARPLQCRTFPFWASNVADRDAWDSAARDCPGMDKGELHGASEIESRLAQRSAEPILFRS